MPYRKRKTYSEKLRKAREAKERKRLQAEPQEYPSEIPGLRRMVIVIDYDFGEVIHIIELYKTNRIDCYRAVADGRPWKDCIDWSKVLEGLRKIFIRVY